MRILVIEDEPRMLELLRKGFYEYGCAVMTASDGEAGLEIAVAHEFDAIVLDVGLPKRDGYELTHLLRQSRRTTPVLMLTARDAEEDIIRGLELGADDYVTKPFSFAELVARLQAITRRHREESISIIEAGDLIIDSFRHTVTRRSTSIDLTRSEFLLLESLMRHVGQCVSREMLMERVWGSDYDVGSGALDVLMNSLRGKVDAPYRHKLICTVRGSGYILRHCAAAVGSVPQ
jgi:DNA-binding response OmpR family regulator